MKKPAAKMVISVTWIRLNFDMNCFFFFAKNPKTNQIHGDIPALPTEALRHADLDIKMWGRPGYAPKVFKVKI